MGNSDGDGELGDVCWVPGDVPHSVIIASLCYATCVRCFTAFVSPWNIRVDILTTWMLIYAIAAWMLTNEPAGHSVPVSLQAIIPCSIASRLYISLCLYFYVRGQAGIGELARALLSFKRPIRRRRTATVATDYSQFSLGGRVMSKCFFSQSAKPNELIYITMFYHSVCLKGLRG